MTDPNKLPPPFDRFVAILELAAAAAGGHVAYDTSFRARKSGDIVNVDAALYLPAGKEERLYVIKVHNEASPVGVGEVDALASVATGSAATGSAIVSATGFDRPARHRADDTGVALVTLGEADSDGLPSWLRQGGFELRDLGWRIRGVALPPVPGLPPNLLGSEYKPTDALFENPQGRRFSVDELFRRWLRAPANEALLAQGLVPGRPTEKPVHLHFDRPMTILANTVRPIPPVLGCELAVRAWIDARHIPMELVEGELPELEGSPTVGFRSPLMEGERSGYLWTWLASAPGADPPDLRTALIPLEGGGAEAEGPEEESGVPSDAGEDLEQSEPREPQ